MTLALWDRRRNSAARWERGRWERGHLPVAKTEAWLEDRPQDVYVPEQYRALKGILDRPSNPFA
ncbi:MAG: hypothetical protein F6J93_02745 [Oscillatoria sp. SIO1A7]|nr:hypothetical protein [Oscillatoria sp. SIO1A7]